MIIPHMITQQSKKTLSNYQSTQAPWRFQVTVAKYHELAGVWSGCREHLGAAIVGTGTPRLLGRFHQSQVLGRAVARCGTRCQGIVNYIQSLRPCLKTDASHSSTGPIKYLEILGSLGSSLPWACCTPLPTHHPHSFAPGMLRWPLTRLCLLTYSPFVVIHIKQKYVIGCLPSRIHTCSWLPGSTVLFFI